MACNPNFLLRYYSCAILCNCFHYVARVDVVGVRKAVIVKGMT